MGNGVYQNTSESQREAIFRQAKLLREQAAQSASRGDPVDYHLAAARRLKDEVHRQYGEA